MGHYNYFRSYSAERGRYTQADPIGLDGGFNRFGYVEGDALNYADPFGLEPNQMCVAACTAGGAAVGGVMGEIFGGLWGEQLAAREEVLSDPLELGAAQRLALRPAVRLGV